MVKKQKFYKRVNRARFHQSSSRQDFIFPYVLTESLRYRGCWRLKYSHLQKPQNCMYEDEIWRAPRLSYHLNVKKITRKVSGFKKGLGVVRHLCKHAWCVNPRHLYMMEKETSEQVALRKEEKEKRILEKYPWKTKEWRLQNAHKKKSRRFNGYGHIKQKLFVHWHHMMRKMYYWGA
jgi:hypothetical protein